MSEMRSLIAVALLAVTPALSAFAQRGGGARGGAVGYSVSLASHGLASSPAFHSSIAPTGHVSFMGRPQFRSGQFNGGRYVGVVSRPPAPVRAPVANHRPEYPVRRFDDRSRMPYGSIYGMGLPYGLAVWPSYLDTGYYDNSTYTDPGYATQPAAADYAPESYPTPPAEQAEAVPTNPYRPAYQRPQPEPEPETPVTLVFKDGRPTEQIRDYILTRTTLYVQDAHAHEIPVADLDLVAMDKVNKAAGVDFQLPASR